MESKLSLATVYFLSSLSRLIAVHSVHEPISSSLEPEFCAWVIPSMVTLHEHIKREVTGKAALE